MKIVLLILFILFFVPIPIKIYFSYNGKNSVLKIYNKYIDLNKTKKAAKMSKAVDKDDIKNSIKKNKSFYLSALKEYFRKLSKTKFKPIFIFSLSFKYSTNDAAITSLLYPLVNELLSLVCTILKIPFKVKVKSVLIEPEYKNKIETDLVINCIFIINIAKLTYMIILLLFSYVGGIKRGKSSNRKFDEVNYGKS